MKQKKKLTEDESPLDINTSLDGVYCHRTVQFYPNQSITFSLNYFLKRENISLNSTRKPDYALLLSSVVFFFSTSCFTICFPFRFRCPPFTILLIYIECYTEKMPHTLWPYHSLLVYIYVLRYINIHKRVESQWKLLNHAHTQCFPPFRLYMCVWCSFCIM